MSLKEMWSVVGSAEPMVGTLVSAPNNPAPNATAVIGGSLGSQQISQSQGPKPSVAQQFKYVRDQMRSKDKVMEYIEAQLNMGLFDSDPNAKWQFESAMRAALEALKK